MPLPSNANTVETAKEVIGLFKGAFGSHPGFRPAHAKGVLLSGTFTPSAQAKSLSTAPHFNLASTPVLARFSNSTGIPKIPDNDDNAVPNGLAIRFQLPDGPDGKRRHTDIIGHSTPHFPTATGKEFGELLKSVGDGSIGDFLASHPAAARHVHAPKPFPESYATQQFFALHAYGLVNSDGKVTWVKYTISPVLGVKTLEKDAAKAKPADYLHDELLERVKKEPVEFKVVATLAKEDDCLNDITKEWEGAHDTMELGTIKLDSTVDKDAEVQKYNIADPDPKVDGINKPEGDQILEFRSAVYLISGKERRAA